jgi:hypothetical protein
VKKVILCTILPIIFVLSACFSDPIQDDLMNYVNKEMTAAFELEATAVTAYDQVSGINYTDDVTMYDALVLTVIPTYNEFIKELNTVPIDTEELREIHEIYIEGADLQYNAFVKIVRALETQDPLLIEEANGMLEEARSLLREYQNEIDKLAKEHDVEWEEKDTTSSL